jgi:hypothetical protein
LRSAIMEYSKGEDERLLEDTDGEDDDEPPIAL